MKIARTREVTFAASLKGIFRSLEDYVTIRLQHFANDVKFLQIA